MGADNLVLFLLLVVGVGVTWLVVIDFLELVRNKFFGAGNYRTRWRADIESGRMPLTVGRYVVDVLYQNRFGWFLLVPVLFVAAFLFWVAPFVLSHIAVDRGSHAGGTLVVAVIGLPVLAFVWFIRAYERDRELTREESNLWSSEFTTLIKAASDEPHQNSIIRRTAIRQLQDYLSGAKWKTNQRSNSTAVFELFSSLVAEQWENLPKIVDESRLAKAARRISNISLMLTISAVMKAVFSKREGFPCLVHVSQGRLDHMHFDCLYLEYIDLSSLSIQHSTFRYTRLWQSELRECDFFAATLTRADFLRSNMEAVDLQFAKCENASFARANLKNANMRRAKLNGCKFTKANLSGVNFTEADLSEADLTKAVLSDAVFTRSDLSGANLTGTGISKEFVLTHFLEVKFTETTIWDDEQVSDKRG